MTKLISCLAVLVAATASSSSGGSACWAQQPPPPPAATAKSNARPDPAALESVQRGRAQFKKSCAFCHGANGDGGAEGPSLIRSSSLRHDENGNLLLPIIREGRPDRGMPPIPLSPPQAADVVTFLHDRLRVLDRTSPGRPSGDRYSAALLSTGSAETGRAFFNGEGGCAQCHSPSGDLAGIARKYPAVDLQARFLYPAAGSKPSTATVTMLATGQRHEGALLRMDAFHVEIQDADGWHHSWPLDRVKVVVHDPLAAHKELLRTKMTNARMHDLFAYLETLK